MTWYEKVTGSLEDKERFRQDRKRLEVLPQPYKDAGGAIFHYVMRAGGISDGDTVVRMMSDLADLLEQASVDGTSLTDLWGDDPVEFMEAFLRAYEDGSWLVKERAKLRTAIRDAGS